MTAEEAQSPPSGQALAAIWKRKGLVILTVLVVMAVSSGLLAVIQRLYTAEALIALNTHNSTLLAQQPVTIGGQLDATVVRTEIDILSSRQLAEQVVTELGLVEDAEFNPFLERKDLLGSLATLAARQLGGALATAWDAADTQLRKLWDHPFGNPFADTSVEAPSAELQLARTVETVGKRLTLKADSESYAVHVSFDAQDPRKAAAVANAFADVYIRNQTRTRFQDAEKATDWIKGQMAQLRQEVDQANRQMADFRQKNRMPLNSDPGLLAAQQLVSLNTDLAATQRERFDVESKLIQARRTLESGADTRSITLADSPFLGSLRGEEARLLGKLADLQSRYRDQHPAVVHLNTQIEGVRRELRNEMVKLVARLNNQVEETRTREATLRGRMQQITTEAGQASTAVSELAQHQRDVEAKNLILQTFLARYNDVQNRILVEKPEARIASRAAAPTRPSHPRPLLFLAIAFTGSLGLGMSLAFLIEHFRQGYVSTKEIRQELGLPTLGVVPGLPRIGRQTSLPDYVVQRPTSVYAEAIRSAQLAILNAAPDAKTKKILITSSLPGEGKTAFAASMGRSMARAGYRTLLVDCDFRRPNVARVMGSHASPGIADFLRQECLIEEVLRTDERSGLQFAPAGGSVQDPQRLLATTIEALTPHFDRFDVVLFDTPPTMVASDAAVLARTCDLALYVVEWEKTPRRAVQAGVEYLQSVGANVAGIVLSKVDLDKQGHYNDYVDFCFRYAEYYGK